MTLLDVALWMALSSPEMAILLLQEPPLQRPLVLGGYEDARYQDHDELISELVAWFNADVAAAVGCTADQAEIIDPLDPTLVKAWLIQETGGNDRNSLDSWRVDPGRVNVPGDWNEWKDDLGLTRPVRPNEGDLRTNVRAAIVYLARKGFGRSGQPPRNNPSGTFDGWEEALRRYNGRTAETQNGRTYRENYAQRILDCAGHPDQHAPIELPKPKK